MGLPKRTIDEFKRTNDIIVEGFERFPVKSYRKGQRIAFKYNNKLFPGTIQTADDAENVYTVKIDGFNEPMKTRGSQLRTVDATKIKPTKKPAKLGTPEKKTMVRMPDGEVVAETGYYIDENGNRDEFANPPIVESEPVVRRRSTSSRRGTISGLRVVDRRLVSNRRCDSPVLLRLLEEIYRANGLM